MSTKPKESTKSASGTGRWQKLIKRFSFIKGIALFGFVGTLIAAYFQYSLSSYQDRLSTRAKEDLAAATDTFVDATNAISTPITLQRLLYDDFARANELKDLGDQKALTVANANVLYKPYEDAYVAFEEKVQVLARKAEIYLDWPSDPFHDSTTQSRLVNDPVSTNTLGAFDFDCEADMPSSDKPTTVLRRGVDGAQLTIDWNSAKHHILTIGYCFDVTHKTWMEVIRQWASGSTADSNAMTKFVESNNMSNLLVRLDRDAKRFDDFMTLAMYEIESIRARYQPSGIACYLLTAARCAPAN